MQEKTEPKSKKSLHRKATGYKGQTVETGKKFTVYFPMDYYQRLKRVAHSQGVSISEFIRVVMVPVLDSSAYERLKGDDA